MTKTVEHIFKPEEQRLPCNMSICIVENQDGGYVKSIIDISIGRTVTDPEYLREIKRVVDAAVLQIESLNHTK